MVVSSFTNKVPIDLQDKHNETYPKSNPYVAYSGNGKRPISPITILENAKYAMNNMTIEKECLSTGIDDNHKIMDLKATSFDVAGTNRQLSNTDEKLHLHPLFFEANQAPYTNPSHTSIRKETQDSFLAKIPKYSIKNGNIVDIRGDIEQLMGIIKEDTLSVIEIQTGVIEIEKNPKDVDVIPFIPTSPSALYNQSPRTIRSAPAQIATLRIKIPDSVQDITLKMFANQTIAELKRHVDQFVLPIASKKGCNEYELRTAFQPHPYLPHQTLKVHFCLKKGVWTCS